MSDLTPEDVDQLMRLLNEMPEADRFEFLSSVPDDVFAEIEAAHAAAAFEQEAESPATERSFWALKAQLGRPLTQSEQAGLLGELVTQFDADESVDAVVAWQDMHEQAGTEPLDLDTAAGRSAYMAARQSEVDEAQVVERHEPPDMPDAASRREYFANAVEGFGN